MSGPRNMMMLRVRRAASTLMEPRSRVSGTWISRSLSSYSHRTDSPLEVSTSSSRLTSSMRATLRSTVVPVFSREAHSRATPAFLLDFTSMEPLSVVCPCTRRWLGPAEPRPTSSESRAVPIFEMVSRVKFCCPRSEEHTSELQSRGHLVCRLLLEKKKQHYSLL